MMTYNIHKVGCVHNSAIKHAARSLASNRRRDDDTRNRQKKVH